MTAPKRKTTAVKKAPKPFVLPKKYGVNYLKATEGHGGVCIMYGEQEDRNGALYPVGEQRNITLEVFEVFKLLVGNGSRTLAMPIAEGEKPYRLKVEYVPEPELK